MLSLNASQRKAAYVILFVLDAALEGAAQAGLLADMRWAAYGHMLSLVVFMLMKEISAEDPALPAPPAPPSVK